MDSHTQYSYKLRPNSEERTATTFNKPKKTRSKVWEKVAWFTRKTKTIKDIKSNSSQETQKDCSSPCLKRRQFSKLDGRVVELRCGTSSTNLSPNTSPNLVKTKSKSGVRKVRSFNYLKRKKQGHHSENAECIKSDVIVNNLPAEMATGTFYDFESTRRRTCRTSSASNLLHEITREVNLKHQGKGNTKSSLSLPLSLLSIGENGPSESSQSNSHRLLYARMGPTYNSWPRKKRKFRSNHYIEVLSPPGSEIKNQNGIEIGVIHFFKSPSISTVKTTTQSDSTRVQCAMEVKSENNLDNNHYADDSDEFYMMNAHSSLCEFFESKDWSNEQLDLFSHELDCSRDELAEHSNSNDEQEKSTCILTENLDKINLKRPLECAMSGDCSTEHAQERTISFNDIYQLKSHIADKRTMKLEISSPIKHTRPEKHLEVIREVSDSTVEEDNRNDHITADSNDAQCATSSQHDDIALLDISCTSCEIPGINETLLDECPLQTIDTLKDTDRITQCVTSLEKDKDLQYNNNVEDIFSLPNIINKDTDRLTNTNISLDTNVYCIKIEGQATDFLEKNDEDHQQIPQITITEHAEKDDIEFLQQHKTIEESIIDINESTTLNNLNGIDNSLLATLEKEQPKDTNILYNSCTDKRSIYTEECFDISNVQLTSQAILKQNRPKVDGQQFKQETETMIGWFSNFNNEQKNIFIRRLLEKCELPQMHMLSVIMESALHKTCPSNCQDMLAWLPHPVTEKILSFLDPVSLCQCSQVNRLWNNLASNQVLWKRLCRSSEWQLSRNAAKKQNVKYTLPSGFIQWKKMFAERFLLRRKWLNGRCRVRTFEGHTQGISCVQFDDTRIVSGSSDKTIKVWDLSRDDGHAVLTLAGHSGTVRCLNLNGNRLVSGSVDKSIKVWDLSFESYWSGASCKVTMIGHMHTVRCLQVDDQKVVSGSYDKTLKVWDIKTGHCKLTLRGHNAAVLCVQFDDTKIVSGSYDNTIKVWSVDEGECLMTLTGHHDAVTCLNLTQDGRKVISGSLDHNLKFWDLATGKCIGTLDWIRSEGHTGVIRCLQSDSWRIVSAGDDKTLKMWSLETGQRLLTLRCHTDGVTCLQFNDYMIVSGSYDKTVKVWSFTPEHEFLNPS